METQEQAKKPRAFVEETDIFDFSNMKKVTEKTNESTSASGIKHVQTVPKKIENAQEDY